ncbi:MAG: ATP-grasp domain-containing protein, partial [Bacteroidales bacterium]|nr:ATP-grasp domain-containing protein [Bacteroidales bacterium]
MIIVDKPYISDFLIESLKKHYLPVLKTPLAEELLGEGPFNFITPAEVIKNAAENNNFSIYTASENSIHWISEHLDFTSLPGNIALFKDKIRFRELTREMYPDFFFKTIQFADLNTIDVTAFPFPFIIKPAVGFFSMGVYKVTTPSDWPDIVKKINRDITGYQKIYPNAVLNTTQFIAEEVINGEEYAFDAYFDENGEPVILGIMKHIFGSEGDVSDRVYYTSAGVIEKNVGRFKEFLQKISRLTGLRNFPLHTEVRVDKQGNIAPIEINPLRFGAWCTSADLMNHAFDFNPYEYVCNRKKPDWDNLVKNAGDNYYSIVILDNSTGYPAKDIESFNFEKLLENFEHPLELREIDFRTYPQFGFLFT